MMARSALIKRSHSIPRWLWGSLVWMLVLSVLTVAGRPAAAQTPADLRIRQLRVQVMPEFDDPRVLVIVQGRLADPAAGFPLTVTFRLPRGAQINQMATMNMASGSTVSHPYDAQPDPEDDRWSLVTYELENAHFFYEYYYDPLVGDPDKTFTFVCSSVYPIDDLLLEVQEPRAVADFTLEPPPTVARFDERFDLTYHQFNLGALAADEETAVAVSYTKTDPAPSVSREEMMGLQGGVGTDSPTGAAQMARTTRLPAWAFLLLGGLALGLAGGFIWSRTQPGVALPEGRGISADEIPFCPQCGAMLKPDARFCHVCGTDVGGRSPR